MVIQREEGYILNRFIIIGRDVRYVNARRRQLALAS